MQLLSSYCLLVYACMLCFAWSIP
uniref:Uncharacterized protein n=1 Tax=Arundo donax TaxID=35708 RepID=A0A0A8Z4K2_ARUDO